MRWSEKETKQPSYSFSFFLTFVLSMTNYQNHHSVSSYLTNSICGYRQSVVNVCKRHRRDRARQSPCRWDIISRRYRVIVYEAASNATVLRY